MIVWRIAKDKYLNELSGKGASLFGGRWNEKGSLMIYCSASKSAAVLQLFLHMDLSLTPKDFYSIPIYIPDSVQIEKLSVSNLPSDWNNFPYSSSTSELGTKWIIANTSLILEVPDVTIYGESNFLINPLHKDFNKIEMLSSESIFTTNVNRLRNQSQFDFYSKLKLKKSYMKDVFICHASEDKNNVVEPIYKALEKSDIKCWYDKNEIKWGDSVTDKVNDGLNNSKYVIVVLSKHFMEKAWPKREMNAALNIEASLGKTKVLPLMVGSKNEIQAIRETLTLQNDKLYIEWDGNPTKIVDSLNDILSNPID